MPFFGERMDLVSMVCIGSDPLSFDVIIERSFDNVKGRESGLWDLRNIILCIGSCVDIGS